MYNDELKGVTITVFLSEKTTMKSFLPENSGFKMNLHVICWFIVPTALNI